MKHKRLALFDAANEVVMQTLLNQGGEGGIIAVDKDGNIAMTFNSAGMYRGYITSEGHSEVLIYKE
jgi:beta-aspartyl-peptidase (threonine type)